ncbi:MAG: hypothetical protein UR82_C0030G0010, partial [Candidatus Moranbacteria bacterium GW2011_GWF1_35_5]
MPENEINEETIIIRETFDLLTYTANIDGKDFFIKEAKSENGVAMNKREFYNQLFLKTMADGKDVGFEFLTPTLAGKRLIYPDITKYSTWLAKDFSPQTKMVPLKEYLQEMIKFMRFCLSMEFEQIPIELKKDTQKRVKNILDKFEKDAKYLLEHGLLEISDIKTLEEKVRSGLHLRNQAFQHHDIVPWHMARKHSDNRLILIDAGWSGWSLKYYDIAYYIFGFLKGEKNHLSKKISLGAWIIEGHWSWATNSIMVFLLGWLPLIVGGEIFSQTLLSYNLPLLTSRLLTLNMLGLIGSA